MAEFSDEEWEEIARKWREAAGLDGTARLNAPEFVRWLKRAGHLKNYVRVPDSQLPGAEGKFEPDEGIAYYRQSTWDAAARGDAHSIWTLIHESAHAILKHKETRLRATSSARLSKRASSDEIQTNRLTACLLAPFDQAGFKLGVTTADDIRQRFGLSAEAAERRLGEFERLYRHRYGIPRPLPPGVVDFLTEQKRKGHVVTSLGNSQHLQPRPIPRYEGDPCACCNNFTLIRQGISMKCDTCGSTMGDD